MLAMATRETEAQAINYTPVGSKRMLARARGETYAEGVREETGQAQADEPLLVQAYACLTYAHTGLVPAGSDTRIAACIWSTALRGCMPQPCSTVPTQRGPPRTRTSPPKMWCTMQLPLS